MKHLSRIAMALLLTAFQVSACSHDDHVIPSSSTIVLVHGAFQGAYVWRPVQDLLTKRGYKVAVVELPGHGDDVTSPATLSIDVYRDQVIKSIPQTGKVILVGHSLGGMVISAVAEKVPDRIEKLVYLAGFVPADGQSALDLASTDSTSLLGPALIPSDDHLTLGIKTENIAPIFVQDGSDAVKKLLVDKYRPEPAIPFTNKAALTSGAFGKTEKHYIHTIQDKTVGYNLQKRMVAAGNIKKTYMLDSGHSPFLSRPDDVINILVEIAK